MRDFISCTGVCAREGQSKELSSAATHDKAAKDAISGEEEE